jgi:hypothetical protein
MHRMPLSRRSIELAVTAFTLVALFTALGSLAGCSGRPSLIPNSDPALRKTSAQFAADAAKRFPFNADLPAGGVAQGRAQVGYGLDTVQVVNLSGEDWDNVELWINRKFVVLVPKIPARSQRAKSLNFQMFFDDRGHYFPLDNSVPDRMIRQLEMVRGGKLYTIPFRLAD